MTNPADREKILNKILKACNIKFKKSKNPKCLNKVWRPEDLDGYYWLAVRVNDSNLRLVNKDDLITSTYMYSLYMFDLACDYLSLRHINKKDYEFMGGVLTLFSDIQVPWEAEYRPLVNCYRLFHTWIAKLLQVWAHEGPPFEFYESMNWPQDSKSTVFYSAGMSALEAMNKFSYSIHRLSFDSLQQVALFNKKEKPEQSMGDFANEWWHFFKTLLNKELPPQVWPESIIKREIDSTKTQVLYEFTQAEKALSKSKKSNKKKAVKKTKTKKRRKRIIKITDKQLNIWERIERGATESELAVEQGCSVTNIRQQYRKAKDKHKKFNAGSRSINFRNIKKIPTDKRGQETVEGKG